ncbi:MAG: hypothetical protein AAGB04_31755, partial [Pseudomonadota bacterium]
MNPNFRMVVIAGILQGIPMSYLNRMLAALSLAAVMSLILNIPTAAAMDWLIKRTNTSVEILVAKDQWIAARNGMRVPAGSTVRSGKRGRA